MRPDARLLLVGGGPMEAALKAQAEASSVAFAIRFVGRVPHAEVERYYSLCDVMAYPRKRSRLTDLVTPTPAGTPILTADVSVVPLAAPTKVHARLVGQRVRKLQIRATAKQADARLQVAVRVHGRWLRASGKRSATIATVHTLPAQLWVRWKRSDGVSSPWAAVKRPKTRASARAWPTTQARGPKPPQG